MREGGAKKERREKIEKEIKRPCGQGSSALERGEGRKRARTPRVPFRPGRQSPQEKGVRTARAKGATTKYNDRFARRNYRLFKPGLVNAPRAIFCAIPRLLRHPFASSVLFLPLHPPPPPSSLANGDPRFRSPALWPFIFGPRLPTIRVKVSAATNGVGKTAPIAVIPDTVNAN
jgi:hypothetical protein